MIRLSFAELITATGAVALEPGRGPVGHPPIAGVTTDSRDVQPGQLFVALAGARHEGHRFAADALERGAAALLLPQSAAEAARALSERAPVALVDDPQAALWLLAAWHRARLGARVVGITGSCGKTSTKNLLAQLLGPVRRVVASPASFNNHLGVPLTLLLAGDDTEVLVAEIGTSSPGEIARLSELARPDHGLLTNIGPAHLEGLGSIGGVALEKSALGAALPADGVLVHDAHCRFLDVVTRPLRARSLRFSVDGGGEFDAHDIHFNGGGTSFRLTIAPEWAGEGPRELEISSPLLGTHSVQNLIAALAMCRVLGVELAEVLPQVRALEGGRQRMERHELNGLTVFDDSYNANPASAAAAVRVLEGLHGFRRRVLVLGDMLELGPEATELHSEVGRQAARSGLDLLVTVGPLAAAAGEGAAREVAAQTARTEVRAVRDTEEALARVPDWIEPGDVVLVKASRALKLERLVERLEQRHGRAPKSGEPGPPALVGGGRR